MAPGPSRTRCDPIRRTDPLITFSAPYCGYPFYSARDTTRAAEFATATMPMHGLYRWHLPDPIHFDQRLKVTLQQIGAWHHDCSSGRRRHHHRVLVPAAGRRERPAIAPVARVPPPTLERLP